MTVPRDAAIAQALYGLTVEVVRQMPRDLSLTAISTLSMIERLGSQRITALASVQGVAQPSMTAMIAGLERSGYVQRRPDPADRRAQQVSLTDKGIDYVLARRRRGAELIEQSLQGLSSEDRATLGAAVAAVNRLREIQMGGTTT
ncbi:MarR family winged helix-turn-helix transcriptional regulator [Williamsia sp. CHRR-6]|uniref:MarR family winged helix-turn-helix transcriptional regulator n=1 Tax=Williamsia sp. CHRR-6 TaxID=2835871 RepID=UPI001BDB4798|nr:MarR family transcriptional regulator [Williamsia sp. CHRR-6]MBT0566501.1 MarR family transcriptional regulator [Williamsia sp. CHRR-6]